MFFGMFSYWTTAEFVSRHVVTTSDSAGRRHLMSAEMNWPNAVRRTTGGLGLFAILVSPFDLFTGFFAMDDGITFKSSPWAWSVKYAWHDVVGVTVGCD
jgi:hypothetical protein